MKTAVFLGMLLAAPALVLATERTSVRGSKHDLSVGGPGPIRATREADACVFCHVAHGGTSKLINRPDPRVSHRPYESGTLRSRTGAPTGATRICLSCHDGTIAVGQTRTRRIEVTGGTSDGKIPASRRSNLGTDLRQSHPVSMVPSRSSAIRAPSGNGRVRLDEHGEVQCTSCHDPHSEFGGTNEGMFLTQATRGAALCGACHAQVTTSSHFTSPLAYPRGAEGETPYATVSDSGCMGCHRSHGASPKGQLMRMGATEREDVICLRCHGATGPAANLALDLEKPYSHAVRDGGAHDAAEGPDNGAHRLPETTAGATRHATCVDCHNAHEANGRPGSPQRIPGSIDGVWGIDQNGRRTAPAAFEYEICLKCHGDSANKPRASTAGSLLAVSSPARDTNLRLVFAASAASAHPVIAPGRNPDVPSLLPPLTAASTIRCTDCHSSDTGSGALGNGPRGPHGSSYPALLERNYSTADYTGESPTAYALCYKCHDREVLLSPARSAFRLHRQHVVEGRAPCSACHVAHGIAATAGTFANNAHLIDFDPRIVKPGPTGRVYTSAGARRGSCDLSCHDHRHEPARY